MLSLVVVRAGRARNGSRVQRVSLSNRRRARRPLEGGGTAWPCCAGGECVQGGCAETTAPTSLTRKRWRLDRRRHGHVASQRTCIFISLPIPQLFLPFRTAWQIGMNEAAGGSENSAVSGKASATKDDDGDDDDNGATLPE
ncbi:hypothetical protein CERZMDRAFT_80153 [Cercospora zeae-maydis SCOH1-5]|uniref:Uncharacterized protein n=1 Tax=Cercospora zeae-maydis SCOH1-5 TaxID=717836 RepID=A0A6A6FVW3_9PEZI|nr:hypothetical protein CERZMDRAFT_80153 [Cercospora zeae-maydis SCOH1-5]